MLKDKQHIHIVGVGGFGMSAIARVLLQRGFRVSGSDLRTNALTDHLQAEGAAIFQGHAAEHITGADLVVATSAAPDDNPELAAARAQGIPVVRRREMLGALLDGLTGIALAGTHGKTTTTAMVVHLLREAGRDPSYIVGGVMQNTGTNAGVGRGSAFVIEADEYGYMFLGLCPAIGVVMNIEHDHPDLFPDEAAVVDAFRAFVARIPAEGVLIAGVDSPPVQALAGERRAAGGRVITYGLDPAADWHASDLAPDPAGGVTFTVWHAGIEQGQARLDIPGRHNVLNALAALAAVDEVGVSFAAAAPALMTFRGTGRRADVMGTAAGVTVINDYAHHPTAIRVVLEAYRERPGVREVWAVWQPHTFSRMRALAADFARAFAAADHALVTDVYSVRENVTPGLDAAGMVELLRGAGHPDARFTGDFEATADALGGGVRPGDIVVVLSAGDAPIVGELLLKKIESPGG